MTGLSWAELGLELGWVEIKAAAVVGDGGEAAVGNEAWAGCRGLGLGLELDWVGVKAAAELGVR
jgi:hypothetical protein